MTMSSLDSGSMQNENKQQRSHDSRNGAMAQLELPVVQKLNQCFVRREIIRETRNICPENIVVKFSRACPSSTLSHCRIPFLLIALLVTAQTVATGQTRPYVRVEVVSLVPAQVRVEVQNSRPQRSWSFRNTVGRVIGLGTRIEQFRASSSGPGENRASLVAAGEFTVSDETSKVQYVVNLSALSPSSDRAHVSWLGQNEGLLMLGDLLPTSVLDENLSLDVVLPPEWSASAFAESERGTFSVDKPAETIIAIGTRIKQKTKQVGALKLTTSLAGDWTIKEDDITKVAQKIIREYNKLTGFALSQSAHLIFISDRNSGPEVWSAEARGRTVTLVMGTNARREALLGRASVVLAHELFHLWVPNSLSLNGEYAWFFEGFTLYQALLTTLKFKWIDFQEFLRTLAAVHDAYYLAPEKDRWSLFQLSERRWTIGTPLVYEKGMLVAFLYDLERRFGTNGKETLSDIYRQLFSHHRASALAANEVIIGLLNEAQGMSDFSSNFVTNPGSLKLADTLPRYGIRLERDNFRTTLRVASDLNDIQRRILRGFRYKK